MDDEMIEKVIAAKSPRVTMLGDRNTLDLDGTHYDITMDDADLLFRSMFFRGSNY